MDDYKILSFLHIVAIVIGLGVAFVFPFLLGFVERRGVGATRLALQFSRYLENVVIYPGGVLIAIFGIGLIFTDATGYKDDMPAWLEIAILWFVAAYAVAFFVQRRQVKDAIASLEGLADGAGFPPAYLALSRRVQMVSGLFILSIIGITFLMVWKP